MKGVKDRLKKVLKLSQEIQTETKMSYTRQFAHNEDSWQSNYWYYWAMIVEVLLFVAILLGQQRYLQAKLD